MSHTVFRAVLWPRCFIPFSFPRWEDPRFRHIINLPWLTWRVMGRVSVQLRSDWNWSCSSIILPGKKIEERFWSLLLEGRKWGVGRGRVVFPCPAGEGAANLLNWRSHFVWPEQCWKHQEISHNPDWDPVLKWDLQTASVNSPAILAASYGKCTPVYRLTAFSVDIPGPPHLGVLPVWSCRYLIL